MPEQAIVLHQRDPVKVVLVHQGAGELLVGHGGHLATHVDIIFTFVLFRISS